MSRMLTMVGMICIRNQVLTRPTDSAMLSGRDCTWSICIIHTLLNLHRPHEAHKADPEYFPSGIWCIQFMMLVSSIVCYEALATWRMRKLCSSVSQGIMLYVHLCSSSECSVAASRLLALIHAMQLQLASDHMCPGLQSS